MSQSAGKGMTEHAARTLYHADTRQTLPVNSELKAEQAALLKEYEARADAALSEVRCALMGRECTCWTFATLIEADRRLRRAAA